MVLGLDVGSCYTKGLLFDGDIKGRSVIKTSFRPNEAIDKLKNSLPGHDKIVATGYGRGFVSDADLIITEITAFARGADYVDSSIRTIIDIGGQDSKVIRIRSGHPERFVMNDRCAAGTGNFIEKITQALGLSLDEFGKLSVRSEKPEMIDSLCVVMAETEILSLVAEGKQLEDVVAGVCNSLVRRIAGIGAQIGIEEPILFAGGGALNPGLIKAMKRIISNPVVSDHPQFIGALGAALSVGRKS